MRASSSPVHRSWLGLLLVLSGCAFATCGRPPVLHRDSGEWGPYEVWLPRGEVRALVFVLSPASGVGHEEQATAAELTRLGVAVALVDTGTYLQRMGYADGPCLEVPGAFLWTSHVLEKELGLPAYRAPYLVGRGAGAGLVYVALAQSPAQALGGGVMVDPGDQVLPVHRALCGLATTATRDGRRLGVYRLPTEWQVAMTRPVTPIVRRWRDAVTRRNRRVPALASSSHHYPALVAEILAPMLQGAATGPPAERMPVVEVKSVSANGVLAVIFSGDGGWRDIDKSVGGYLAERGLAVLGVDALSYFWEKRTPEEVGADATAMLRAYLGRWKQQRVALIGYSFGADVLPFVYARLPPDLQRRVVVVSLLAPSRRIDFEVNLSDWLGADDDQDAFPIAPELVHLPTEKLQCIYGADDADDSLCTGAALPAAAVMQRPGDHHFDGDYESLGAIVLEGITRRLRGSGPLK